MQQKEEEMPDEEKELMAIEELSQKLEITYKDMEQIRRENLLFESYILRHQKDLPKEDEIDDKTRKKGNKNKVKQELTNEEKYEIAQFESEALKKNIEQGRIQSDSVLETLRAILEETDMAITEIRKDAFDFQREILIGGENSRTGKIEAERIIKYFEDKLRQKEQMIEKYKTKKQTLESQIYKTNNQIIKKEEQGDDLKFIDFHQLQIENKKYIKEIEEKNKKLLKLKLATGKISQVLIDERNQLNKRIDEVTSTQKEIEKKSNSLEKIKKQLDTLKNTNGDKKGDIPLLVHQISLLEKKLQIENSKGQGNDETKKNTIEYVKLKKSVRELQSAIQNLKRKIEIKERDFKKANKFLNQQ